MKQHIMTTLKKVIRLTRTLREQNKKTPLKPWTKESGRQMCFWLPETDPNQLELFTTGKGE